MRVQHSFNKSKRFTGGPLGPGLPGLPRIPLGNLALGIGNGNSGLVPYNVES